MQKILTADQFVAGVIAVLALQDRKRFVLTDTELDDRFQRAYEDLRQHEVEYDVKTNFSFYVDPMHGDSVCLRDTLLAAKEKELIALNNPTFKTFDVKLDARRAERYLSRTPLPRDYLFAVVNKYFSDLDDRK